MPISIKRDVAPAYGLKGKFSLRETPLYIPLGGGEPIRFGDHAGSYLKAVRPRIADENWYEFYRSWKLGPNVGREVAKAIAEKFNLRSSDHDTFDKLWHFVREARGYGKKKKKDKKNKKSEIQKDLDKAYRLAAQLATGRSVGERTLSRTVPRSDRRFVVFSDHHMTALDRLPNYFKDFNYALYLDVLRHYATTNFCLVENGDVEECVIYDPQFADAKARKKAAPKKPGIDEIAFPVSLSDHKWDDFLDMRYAQRARNLSSILAEFGEYNDLLRRRFIRRGKYVRLTGNHDTYLNQDRERDLRDRIEDELGIKVYDVLRIERSGKTRYVVLHGHQFDPNCMQHGAVPFAKSLGEIYSECLSWAYQGPDRAWTSNDTKRWYHGNTYRNVLAREEPGKYKNWKPGQFDLVTSDWEPFEVEPLDDIKAESEDFIENLLGHEVAWDYFENRDGFQALTLEVWTSDEMYKLRHMHELDLCERYAAEFAKLSDAPVPKLVLGHTHEPRQNAAHPFAPNDTTTGAVYLNSGSAGRFQNLIWCVEIRGLQDQICSWSRVDGRLKKIGWRSDRDTLVHDSIEWIDP